MDAMPVEQVHKKRQRNARPVSVLKLAATACAMSALLMAALSMPSARTATAWGGGATDELRIDCNQNAVDDAVEIASGLASDLNENGLIDQCEHALDVGWSQRHLRLGPVAVNAQDRHVRVLQSLDGSMLIACVVAVARERVRLVATYTPREVVVVQDTS